MVAQAGQSIPKGRIPAIDGLRAVAVGMVFIYHAYPHYFPGGFLGVDIFFVISGFVITRALLAEGVQFKQFYIHRALRILPPAIPVLLLSTLVVMEGSVQATYMDVAAAALSVMNWTRALNFSGGGFIGHFWSLSVEEQFYILWPTALFLILVYRVSLIPLLIVVIAIFTVWQIILFTLGGGVDRVYNGLDTRGSQLLAGCLLAALGERLRPGNYLTFAALGFFFVCLLFLHFDSSAYMTVGIPLVGFAAAVLVSALAEVGGRVWGLHVVLESRLFQWGGSRSYAIYLWHYPILRISMDYTTGAGLPAFYAVATSLLLTLMCAELSWRLVERPMNKLRRKSGVSGGGKPIGQAITRQADIR